MTIDPDSFSEGKEAARDVKNAIKEGADQVKSSATARVRSVKRGASRVASQVSDGADRLADELETGADKVTGVREELLDIFSDLYDDTLTHVRDRPLSVLAVAALGGAVIALLLRRAGA